MTQNPHLDAPPESSEITSYDREHMKLYMRILDAASEGADWREVVTVLFDLDPYADPDRARTVHDGHLSRARWMTTNGYRLLVQEGYKA